MKVYQAWSKLSHVAPDGVTWWHSMTSGCASKEDALQKAIVYLRGRYAQPRSTIRVIIGIIELESEPTTTYLATATKLPDDAEINEFNI